MGGRADLVGRRFGRLLVIEALSERSKNGCVLWRCKCDCGNEHIVMTQNLTNGNTQSCGCIRKYPSMIGLRFGRLIVTDEAQKQSKRSGTMWKCRCDCGNQVIVSTGQLNNGSHLSCGCLRHERMKSFGKVYSPRKQLTGMKIGMISVGERMGVSSSHSIEYRCKCDCGNELIMSSAYLLHTQNVSCGCANGYLMSRKRRYEEIVGEPVPEGHTVVFLDGDISNWNKENLYHISRANWHKMHRREWFFADPEYTLTAIKVCELESEIKSKSKQR